MFPRGGSSSSTDQPDPNCTPSTTAPDSRHSHPSSSSTSSSTMNIPTDNTSLMYLQQQFQQAERQQQISLSNLHQWPHISHCPAAELAPQNTEGLSRYATNYMPAASLITREEAQQLLMQQHPVGGGGHKAPTPLRGLSMVPGAVVEQQLYNEQLLRSLSGRTQLYGSGVEPRSMYDSLQQELQVTANLGSSSVLNRTLENIGRSASSEPSAAAAAAAGRYEETCTPRPRWCPTQEQIQILESLFNSGTTTPSRDMIVDIAAQLRKYGTIAEANVFYWFQNRKARAKRKLQPPGLSSAAAPAPASSSSSTGLSHQLDSAADRSPVAAAAAAGLVAGAAEHPTTHISKSRRLSLKHTSASSPTSSSSSPDRQHSISGPTSSSPSLQAQYSLQSIQISKPSPLLQETSSLLPSRSIVTSTAASVAPSPAISRIHQPSALYNPWSHDHHLERQPTEGASDVSGAAASSAMPSYPHPLLLKHESMNPADPQMETFHNLLDYPRISLSLAPPTDQHQTSQALGHGQTHGGLGSYSTQYSDHQLLQATNKGIMLINPQEASGRDPLIGDASSRSSMSSAMFPQLGTLLSSRAAAAAVELRGRTMEFNPLQPLQLPQSSLPLARLADYQQGAPAGSTARVSTTSAPAASSTSNEDPAQLQMWEDLDSACGGPWNSAAGPGGHR